MMRHRLITMAGFAYVTYAILTAYTALASIEAAHPNGPDTWAQPKGLAQVDRAWQPMDYIDTPTYANVKNEYRVEVWVGQRCHWCDKFKRRELPKLKKAGVRVEVKETWKVPRSERPKDLRVVPMIKVYRRSKCIKTFHGYEKAETILTHVKHRVVLMR